MTSPRTIVIEGNDRDGYSAVTPALPELSCSGATVDEAEQRMRVLLRQRDERAGMVQVEVEVAS